jgi:hypothetical protein
LGERLLDWVIGEELVGAEKKEASDHGYGAPN